MTLFGRNFDFHGVIYDVQPCNVDNRWRNVILLILDFSNVRKMIFTNLMTDLWPVIYHATDHCKRKTIS